MLNPAPYYSSSMLLFSCRENPQEGAAMSLTLKFGAGSGAMREHLLSLKRNLSQRWSIDRTFFSCWKGKFCCAINLIYCRTLSRLYCILNRYFNIFYWIQYSCLQTPTKLPTVTEEMTNEQGIALVSTIHQVCSTFSLLCPSLLMHKHLIHCILAACPR